MQSIVRRVGQASRQDTYVLPAAQRVCDECLLMRHNVETGETRCFWTGEAVTVGASPVICERRRWHRCYPDG